MVIASQKVLIKYVSSLAPHFFISPDVSPTFCMVITVASRTTHRHSRNDPREDVGVGVVECQLNGQQTAADCRGYQCHILM